MRKASSLLLGLIAVACSSSAPGPNRQSQTRASASTSGPDDRHPIVVVADADVFDSFTFSPVVARSLMDVEGWAGTITMLRAIGPTVFEARNIFPVGRITEDPATGSAAASLGGYLRELGLVEPPARVTVHQGRHVGRPSVLAVDIPTTGGITVSGTAVLIQD